MRDRKELTGRQAMVLDHVRKFIGEKGYAPTLRELGELTGIKSTNGINDHLIRLEQKGYIRKGDMRARSLVLVDQEGKTETMPTMATPSVLLPAGSPGLLLLEDMKRTSERWQRAPSLPPDLTAPLRAFVAELARYRVAPKAAS